MSRPRRCTLFVGALALEHLAPALESGADLVCVDLEDAVPPERKAEARTAAVAVLARTQVPPGVQLVVRVNPVGTAEGDADIVALLAKVPAVSALMLPKVETASDVINVAQVAETVRSPVQLYAIIETAQGLEDCCVIARAHPRLRALFFGGFDLSTALGCVMDWEPLLYARSRVVHAGALGGIDVIDSPFPDVNDLKALRDNCDRVKALGMTGKCAKQASQVETIREAFTPTVAEITRARRIIELFREDPTRPLVFEGKLVELPAIRKLERLASINASQ